jgi:hypothetical protein
MYRGVEVYMHHSWYRQQAEMSGQFHALAGVPLGKEIRYSLHRWLSWPQMRSGCCGEQKITFPSLHDNSNNNSNNIKSIPNIGIERMRLLLPIRKASGSNLFSKSGYLIFGFPWFSHEASATSIDIFSFVIHPNIRRCVVMTTSLNKL